jgi:WD40 repeat protein
VTSVVFSPDGKMLAWGSDDGNVRLLEVARRQPLRDPLAAENGGVNSVAFSPDGRTLAAAGANGTVQLWDVDTRQRLGAFGGHIGVVSSVGFSPDSKSLPQGARMQRCGCGT